MLQCQLKSADFTSRINSDQIVQVKFLNKVTITPLRFNMAEQYSEQKNRQIIRADDFSYYWNQKNSTGNKYFLNPPKHHKLGSSQYLH